MSLRDRIARAKSTGAPQATDRARGGLLAWLDSAEDAGIDRIADGTAAAGIGRVGMQATGAVPGLACAEGCAFCCILKGQDGGLITEAEARHLHDALSPLAGQPDGRAWHAQACAALDPETRRCRAYRARPMICRSYVSIDATACQQVAEGEPAEGPGTLGPYHVYLAALGLSRTALKSLRRVPTFALSRLTAAAVDGASLQEALSTARHKPTELDAELKRSRRDHKRAGLP